MISHAIKKRGCPYEYHRYIIEEDWHLISQLKTIRDLAIWLIFQGRIKNQSGPENLYLLLQGILCRMVLKIH